MKNLKKDLGLEVRLKDNFKLELDIKLLGGEFSSRSLSDMASVLKDKIKLSDDAIYYMYRDIRERSDEEKIKSASLRFDLTVILPRMIGSEFNKTLGHYHPSKEGTEVAYPEVYEVVAGKGLFLLQKPGKSIDKIIVNYLVEVEAGEKVVIPPSFGHITINPSSEPLIMSNWVADEFSSEYDSIKEMHGGSYYICGNQKSKTQNPKQATNSNYQIVKNKHYLKTPKPIFAKPKELSQFGLEFGKPMYLAGTKNISKLDYLNNPENYLDEIKPESIFIF